MVLQLHALPKTRKVLIECAYFNPESIIGKSVKYNLVSDAAHKFERGVDIESQEKTLRRFIKVVQDHVKIKSIKFKSFSEKYKQSPSIQIDVNKINKILGTSLEKNEYLKYLKDLGFYISDEIKYLHIDMILKQIMTLPRRLQEL